MRRAVGGFTLIELLIVVAIIGILAAIAIPNFLMAQTRAKVARAKSEMAAIATGLRAYRVDNNMNLIGPGHPYEPAPWWQIACGLCGGLWLPTLSTPVAYMTAVPTDPFALHWHADEYMRWLQKNYWYYVGFYEYRPAVGDYLLKDGMWLLTSNGPDIYPFEDKATGQTVWGTSNPYDPTNGLISSGNIYRSELRPEYAGR